MAEGSQAYTEGDLDLALARFRQARERGADAAELHYNLGNTHARRGELGRAIASYLRAERRAPRDGDTRRNLAWVRQHTRDLELVGQGLPPVVAQLDRLAHWLSVREWGLVVVVLSWLSVPAVAWAWWRGGLETASRRALVLAWPLLVAAAAITATRWYEEQVRDTAVVVVDEVEVRSGPATTFPVVFRIHDGLVWRCAASARAGAASAWGATGSGGCRRASSRWWLRGGRWPRPWGSRTPSRRSAAAGPASTAGRCTPPGARRWGSPGRGCR